MKKAIVTGGNGFIGSNLVDNLVDLGIETIVIDNNSAECNERFYFNEKAKNYKYDICDYDKILPLFKGVDVVFHLAAESRIQPSILNPTYATKVNVLGTCNILQAARENDVDRVIYSSTSAGYGLKNSPPLREDMPKDCLNPYSVTKCAGEELCVMYNNLFGLKTISLRYFNVYGNREPVKGQYAPVVGLFLRQFRNNEAMTIVGDGLQRRDFTNVQDVVQANILAGTTTNLQAFGEVYNVGTGINHSVLELAQFIGGKYEFIDSRIGEARNTLADNSKIRNYLNWQPKVDFLDYLKKELNK
jgi:UDP-glucose 4-epimerase